MTEDLEKPGAPAAENAEESSISEPQKKKEFTDWDYARAYAEQIGQPHRLFTNCIRYLRQVRDKTDNAPLSSTQAGNYPICLLIHSSSFKSIIYYAAKSLHPSELASLPVLTPGTLLSLYTPDELCSVITIAYLYRRARRQVEPKIWEGISGEVQIQMETGYHIGHEIKSIGVARGLLIGALRYVAMSLYSKKDQRGYKMHKRHLNEDEVLFDLADETNRWKCNHLQICSVLLQSIGYGLGAATGISSLTKPSPGRDSLQSKEALLWYATREWVHSLLERELAPPEFTTNSDFSMTKEAISQVQKKVEAIYENGSNFDWIDKTKEDLPEDLSEALKSPEDPNANPKKKEEELPHDII